VRDDRVEAFATELPEGVWFAVLDAIAMTPGRYVVPPPRAEEMYTPEVFGRGIAETVFVD